MRSVFVDRDVGTGDDSLDETLSILRLALLRRFECLDGVLELEAIVRRQQDIDFSVSLKSSYR